MRKGALLIGLIAIFGYSSAQLTKTHAFNDPTTQDIQVINLENDGQKICVNHIHRSGAVFHNTGL